MTWRRETLGNACRIFAGYGFPERLQGQTKGEIPFYKVGDISEAWKKGETYLTTAKHYLTEAEARELKAKPLPAGTTVFAKIGAAIALNRRAMLPQPALVDNNVMGLLPATGDLEPKFLFHFVCTLRLNELSRATTVPSIRKSDVEHIELTVPPLDEQQRIVAEIEKQSTRLDVGVASLKRVQTTVKRYRASVLKAACEGEKWKYTNLGEVVLSMKNGIYKPRTVYADNGVACLRMYNIGGGKIIWKDIKRMRLSKKEIDEYRLLPGDVLVNRVNSRELVGKAAPISDGLEVCVFESKNIRVRLNRELVDPKFVGFAMAVYGQAHFNRNAQQVVGMASISQPQVSALQIPLPPLAEQTRIVAEAERKLSAVEDLKTTVSTDLRRATRLRQAILHHAFNGRLLPADET